MQALALWTPIVAAALMKIGYDWLLFELSGCRRNHGRSNQCDAI
jgi:hypothetical protein